MKETSPPRIAPPCLCWVPTGRPPQPAGRHRHLTLPVAGSPAPLTLCLVCHPPPAYLPSPGARPPHSSGKGRHLHSRAPPPTAASGGASEAGAPGPEAGPRQAGPPFSCGLKAQLWVWGGAHSGGSGELGAFASGCRDPGPGGSQPQTPTWVPPVPTSPPSPPLFPDSDHLSSPLAWPPLARFLGPRPAAPPPGSLGGC